MCCIEILKVCSKRSRQQTRVLFGLARSYQAQFPYLILHGVVLDKLSSFRRRVKARPRR